MRDQKTETACPASDAWAEDGGKTVWASYRGPEIPLGDVIEALANDRAQTKALYSKSETRSFQ